MCADTANSQTGLDNFLAQSFGPNSRCVEHGQLEWTAEQGGASRNNPVWNAGCYDVIVTLLQCNTVIIFSYTSTLVLMEMS